MGLLWSCKAPASSLVGSGRGCVHDRRVHGVEGILLPAGTPRGHRKLLENFVQLKSDNKLLAEENARLEAQLVEVQHARGGITTVPVPGQQPCILP